MPPLKIIVANSQVPLVETANDRLAKTLADVLLHFGHRVTRLRIPLPPTADALPQAITSARLMDLTTGDGEPGDCLIALDLLSGCLRHHRKVLWIADLLGGLGSSGSQLTRGPEPAILRRAARLFLCEALRRLTTSTDTASKLQQLANLGATTLISPLPGDLPSFAHDRRPAAGEKAVLLVPPESSRFPISRLCEVMERCEGTPFIGYHRRGHRDPRELIDAAKQRALSLKWLGELDQEPEHVPEVRAVWLSGIEESLPWPAWRALARRKPVVTTLDAGVCAEIIRDAQAGPVVASDPETIARALDLALRTPPGEAAEHFLRESYPLWRNVMDELLREGRA